MQRSRIFAIVLRQFYLMRGSVARIIPLFVWVAIDIVLWGFITRYLNQATDNKLNFIPAMLGGVLLWDFLTRVMQGVTMAFFEDVWSRNFLNIFATPLSIVDYASGLVISSIATSSIGLVVMLVLAGSVFGLSYAVYGLMFLPFLLILFLFGIALGVAGCAIVLRFGPAAEWFIWPIPALLSPFCCVFYPLGTLPQWMQVVSYAMPPMYVFEGMRTLVAHATLPASTLGFGIALALIDILAAGWFLTRVYRIALRSGLIARYSAESLS